MKNFILSLALALAASSTAALAQTAPAEQTRTVHYHSQDIVPIRAEVKYTTLTQVLLGLVLCAHRSNHRLR